MGTIGTGDAPPFRLEERGHFLGFRCFHNFSLAYLEQSSQDYLDNILYLIWPET